MKNGILAISKRIREDFAGVLVDGVPKLSLLLFGFNESPHFV
jgi:hypothetical protein